MSGPEPPCSRGGPVEARKTRSARRTPGLTEEAAQVFTGLGGSISIGELLLLAGLVAVLVDAQGVLVPVFLQRLKSKIMEQSGDITCVDPHPWKAQNFNGNEPLFFEAPGVNAGREPRESSGEFPGPDTA